MNAVDQRVNEINTARQEVRDMLDEVRARSAGGGGDGGMNARVGRIEGRLDKVIDEVSGLKERVATLAERVAHLPSKGFVVTTGIGVIAALTAVITFAEKLQALVK